MKITNKFLTINGKRHAISISKGPWVASVNPAQIKIRPRGKSHFAQDIRDALKIENGSDMMTDYFEADQIRLLPGHPLYDAALAA